MRRAIADYYENDATEADCRDALAALPTTASSGPSDVRAALVRRVRTNAEWLGTPFLLAAGAVLTKILCETVQVLIVYGKHGPQITAFVATDYAVID